MPQPFVRITGVAAPLLEDHIDTDLIFPARYLLLMERNGLGDYLFRDRRRKATGEKIEDFILNRPPYTTAKILLAGDNFGCGSSREQAVWALSDFGIRCVVAPSFGEIFHANCARSGLLAVQLPAEAVRRLAEDCAGHEVTVDLPEQVVQVGASVVPFQIKPGIKEALLNGWDEIDVLLAKHAAGIETFEQRQRQGQPWLYE